ncbi:uncharacterized protein LOC128957753 [Oppia nitens]|uniref:uncharacterized protein LOC128957753 n=1 Tax=Oppia nitens TaxID=1686743 RepID=UPI0023DC0966|nr:uncharacterized protein LOC128957753 [Oppia nitens]
MTRRSDIVVVIDSHENYYTKHLCIDRHNWSVRVKPFDGQSSTDGYLVPNIVHYILFKIHEIQFAHFLSVLSVLKNHRPDSIYIHCDCRQLTGQYWQRLVRLANATKTRLILRTIERPIDIFGQPLSLLYRNFHASDITRIRLLLEFGGIYLDRDVYVVKNLDPFRNYEMTLDFERTDNGTKVLASQTLLAHRNARFLKLWLMTYCDYRPDLWYYNTGELPTKEIINKRPDLIHGLNGEFGADGRQVCPQLYNQYRNDWRQTYYSIHLLIRGDSLNPESYCLNGRRPVIYRFDEHNVRQLMTTFGEMARDVLDYEITVNK